MDYSKLYDFAKILIPIVMIVVEGIKHELLLEGMAVKILAGCVSFLVTLFYCLAIVPMAWPFIVVLYFTVALCSMFGYNLLTTIFKRGP